MPRIGLLSGVAMALVLAGVSFIPAPASASLLEFQPLAPVEILLAQRAIADSGGARADLPQGTELQLPEVEPPAPVEVEKRKSPAKAFLYNILLPGAGHLYMGNKRGWAHIGMEGVAWATFLYYRERGHSKEDEYAAHADEHWDYTRWVNACQCQGTPEDSLIVYFRANNKQHFYEDIVKLSTYSQGWDDPSNRSFNRGMRQDSNQYLKNARYAVVGGFVNRVVSAVDALRILKNKGRALIGNDTQLSLRLRTPPFSDETAFGFQVKKRL